MSAPNNYYKIRFPPAQSCADVVAVDGVTMKRRGRVCVTGPSDVFPFHNDDEDGEEGAHAAAIARLVTGPAGGVLCQYRVRRPGIRVIGVADK
jgi:hypothetical protein